MPTAVVVATIVNTNLSEAGFRQHVVEQLRVNDRSLLDRLADADDDANVVTAVLNVDEFLAYLIRRFPKAVDAALVTDEMLESAPPEVQSVEQSASLDTASIDTASIDAVSTDTAKMSEGDFMDFVLQQLEAGEIPPMVRYSDEYAEDEWDDDGDIGEDISRHPFYY